MPSLSIGAAGVPSTNKVPAIFLAVVFGAGVNLAGGGTREVLLFGNKTTAGTAVADTDVSTPTTIADSETYWGISSELSLMYEFAALMAPGATIRGMAVTEAVGATATATLTIVGAAGGTDTYSLFIHGVQIDVAITSGDAIATQATNIANAINGSLGSRRRLLVTASAALGVVTITFRQIGTRGNLCTVRQIVGLGITTSTYTLSGATLSGGTGDDTLTAALAAVASSTYKYYANAHVNTAQLQLVQTQLTTMAGPLQGRRQLSVYASRATLAVATTQVQTLNENRMQCIWHKNSETYPGIIAAVWAAYRSVAESRKISANHDSTDLFPYVLAQPTLSDQPTDVVKGSALDVGLTPLGVDARTKHAYVVRSITTHSQASSNPDTRTLDTTKVVVPDELADRLATALPSAFPNLNIIDDPVDSTDDDLPPGTTTPRKIKSFCAGIARTMQTEGHIVNFDNDYLSWAFNLAPASPGRVNATMPVSVISGLHQISASVLQVA